MGMKLEIQMGLLSDLKLMESTDWALWSQAKAQAHYLQAPSGSSLAGSSTQLLNSMVFASS